MWVLQEAMKAMHLENHQKAAQLHEAKVEIRRMREGQQALRHDLSTQESTVSELRLTVSLLRQQLGTPLSF